MKNITRLSLWMNTGRCFGMGLEDKLRRKIVGISTGLRRRTRSSVKKRKGYSSPFQCWRNVYTGYATILKILDATNPCVFQFKHFSETKGLKSWFLCLMWGNQEIHQTSFHYYHSKSGPRNKMLQEKNLLPHYLGLGTACVKKYQLWINN